MKKLLFFVLMGMLLPIKLYSFKVGSFEYTINSDKSTVTISKADGAELNGKLEIPSQVTYDEKDYAVTAIGWNGFADTEITEVYIPSSVTQISKYAFSGCAQLAKVLLPTRLESLGSHVFYDCDKLSTIESHVFFPIDYTSNAFTNSQYADATLYVPTGSLDRYKAAGNWSKFAHIVEMDMDDVDSDMFKFEVTGDNTVSVAAYSSNRLIGDIVIPETANIDGKTYTVTMMASYGFEKCSRILSVKLPSTVKEIGWWVFKDCTGMKEITLPESLEEIGSWAFYGCSSLEEITIPKNVTGFGWGVFAGGCNMLKDIKVAEGNSSLKSEYGMLLSTSGTTMYAYAHAYPEEHLVIPETVTWLNQCALFSHNNKLKSIVVPSGVTSIGGETFYHCTALTNVSLPDGIKSFSYSVFSGCAALESITIPASTTSISTGWLSGCNALDSVIVRQTKPMEIESAVFTSNIYSNATLYVPIGRSKYFKEANGWSSFAKIKEIEMDGIEISDSPYENIEENQMVLGYYSSDAISESGYGGRNAGLYKVCIGFSREQMIPFAGNQITNVRFALKDVDIAGLKLWIGSTRDKKDLCSQSVSSPQLGWNEVALQSPYEITGDSIFIGIEYKQSGTRWPVSVVSEGAELGSSYFYGPYNGADNDEIWLTPDENKSVSLQCIVEGDRIPQYDLHTSGLSFSTKYIQANNNYYANLYLRNWGKKSISNATIACEIDDVEIATGTVSSVSRTVKSNSLYFKVGDITPSKHKLTLRVKDINGNAPEFPSDDAQSLYIKSNSQDMGRDKVMLELYTATWCPYTPRAHKSIAALMEERDDIVLVSNHLSDAMSCDASDAYGVFTHSTPTTYYDRYASYGATSLGSIGIDAAKVLPSLAKLNITAEYDDNNRLLTIKVKGVKNEEFDAVEEYANLTVLLTEDSIKYPQNNYEEGKYVYDYVHNGVLRTNVSEIWGDPITWTGDKFEKTYTIRLDDDWVKDNMHVVAFLAKPFMGSNYEEIGLINCNEFLLRNAKISSGIADINDDSVTIYVEGRTVFVRGNYRSMQVYGINGATAENGKLREGTYIVKVLTSGGIIVKKISIR